MWPRMHFLDLQGLYVFWTAGVTTVYSCTEIAINLSTVELLSYFHLHF